MKNLAANNLQFEMLLLRWSYQKFRRSVLWNQKSNVIICESFGKIVNKKKLKKTSKYSLI